MATTANLSKLHTKTVIFTGLALVAFAGNSILCRLALGGATIDAASFTTIRLLSGIVVLMTIVLLNRPQAGPRTRGSWRAAVMLFLYAATFSFAYLTLATGVGALILFGSVQITMILAALLAGHRLHYTEWLGVLVAFTGFVYLVMPGIDTPPLSGFLLMTTAGIAWGIYTLSGRGSSSPLGDTAYNFLRTLPFIVILMLIALRSVTLSPQGVLLAVLSGGIASGIGYTIWYIALAGLSPTQAAVVQLLVPVIAAIGGVLFANEIITLRLVVSSLMVLGGILLVVLGRRFLAAKRPDKKQ